MKDLVPHSPFGSSNVFSAVIPSNQSQLFSFHTCRTHYCAFCFTDMFGFVSHQYIYSPLSVEYHSRSRFHTVYSTFWFAPATPTPPPPPLLQVSSLLLSFRPQRHFWRLLPLFQMRQIWTLDQGLYIHVLAGKLPVPQLQYLPWNLLQQANRRPINSIKAMSRLLSAGR